VPRWCRTVPRESVRCVGDSTRGYRRSAYLEDGRRRGLLDRRQVREIDLAHERVGRDLGRLVKVQLAVVIREPPLLPSLHQGSRFESASDRSRERARQTEPIGTYSQREPLTHLVQKALELGVVVRHYGLYTSLPLVSWQSCTLPPLHDQEDQSNNQSINTTIVRSIGSILIPVVIGTLP